MQVMSVKKIKHLIPKGQLSILRNIYILLLSGLTIYIMTLLKRGDSILFLLKKLIIYMLLLNGLTQFLKQCIFNNSYCNSPSEIN